MNYSPSCGEGGRKPHYWFVCTICCFHLKSESKNSHPSPAEELYNSSMAESQIVPSVRTQSHSRHFPCSLVNFLSTGMKSVGKDHPWKRILIHRDEISRDESSSEEIFYPQGWYQPGWIILGREFLSAGMKSARKNHPQKRIFICRDEISADESSLEEIFHPQGWYQPGIIILGRDFLSAGMKSASPRAPRSRNCPRMRF